ncbi:crossover junction endonuclease MUS81 isoform X2 [Euwallacea similis]|uniref:crossover junction endonuclease MUS81 isoform X2 n=1 Tax=Euwallacea similis TaxID=1736056 RepID=UPI00344E671E
MNSQRQQRVTVKLKCPNPLFEEWLTTWRDQAIEKNSKMQYSFDKALKYLRKYPLPLNSGIECKILKGFGNKLCKMLEEKLMEHNKNSSQMNDHSSKKYFTIPSTQEYIPQYRSGGYAILVTLYKRSLEQNYEGHMKKAEIIKYGKDLIDCSFSKPDPGLRYTAWSSMKILLAKKLVSKVSNPAKFSLTTEGYDLAKKLYEKSLEDNLKVDHSIQELDNGKCQSYAVLNVSEELTNDFLDDHWVPEVVSPLKFDSQMLTTKPGNNLIETKNEKPKTLQKFSSCSTISSETSSKALKKFSSSSSVESTFEDFTMVPFSFDVILYVDNCETSGSSNSENDDILVQLSKSGIKYEVQDLKVGDFVWICRDRVARNELVLPYIIERKRMDDFGHSIKDQRYYEQKFRLKHSGIENLTYLVESHGNNQHCGLPLESLMQAATNTAIQENFFIKFTANIRETAHYLASFSKHLIDLFKGKSLASCPKTNIQPIDINSDLLNLITFKEFNESSMKNEKIDVTDLFVKMLIQIKGMSVGRALAVTQKYPTPLALKSTYKEISPEMGEKLLSAIKYGPYGKQLGAALSKSVYNIFCKTRY